MSGDAGRDFSEWAGDGELALSLSARHASAPLIRQFETWPTGWVPVSRACHANADRWMAANPNWRVLRGWVLLANAPFEGAHYAAHSVIEDPAGNLWDVTLIDGAARGFLAHLGELRFYELQVARGPWTIVREPLPAVDQ